MKIASVFVTLLVLVSVPVFSTVLPPLVDYPNHLARMFLLASRGNDYFQPHWSLLPNLAEDAVVPFLARLMPIDLAAKLFIVATFALTAGGTVWLNRVATGRWHYWPLLGFLILYNRSFLWGFLNYSCGIGLVLCGLASFLALERAPIVLRVGIGSLVALICYFSHIEAFGVYAVAIVGLELLPFAALIRRDDWAGVRYRVLSSFAQFILPVGLYFVAWHESAGMGWSWNGYARKADLLFSVFDNYNRVFDVICFLIFVGTLIFVFARRWVRPVPRVIAAALLLFVVYLVIPSQLFSGSGADHRLPPAIFLLVIASGVPNFPKPRGISWLVFGALLLFALRWTVIERVWLAADRVYQADIGVLDQLSVGSKLAVAFPPGAVNMVPVPIVHLPVIAVERRAVFVPTLFAFPAQQPISLTDAAATLMVRTPEALWDDLANGVETRHAVGLTLRGYDYLVVLDRHPFDWQEDPCFKPLSLVPDFKLFWIDHAACDEQSALQPPSEPNPDAAPGP